VKQILYVLCRLRIQGITRRPIGVPVLRNRAQTCCAYVYLLVDLGCLHQGIAAHIGSGDTATSLRRDPSCGRTAFLRAPRELCRQVGSSSGFLLRAHFLGPIVCRTVSTARHSRSLFFVHNMELRDGGLGLPAAPLSTASACEMPARCAHFVTGRWHPQYFYAYLVTHFVDTAFHKCPSKLM